MANDPDALLPSGPVTRRGLLSIFSRRAVEALPVGDGVASAPVGEPFDPFARGASRLDRAVRLR